MDEGEHSFRAALVYITLYAEGRAKRCKGPENVDGTTEGGRELWYHCPPTKASERKTVSASKESKTTMTTRKAKGCA